MSTESARVLCCWEAHLCPYRSKWLRIQQLIAAFNPINCAVEMFCFLFLAPICIMMNIPLRFFCFTSCQLNACNSLQKRRLIAIHFDVCRYDHILTCINYYKSLDSLLIDSNNIICCRF